MTDKRMRGGWNIRKKMEKLKDGATCAFELTVDEDNEKVSKKKGFR